MLKKVIVILKYKEKEKKMDAITEQPAPGLILQTKDDALKSKIQRKLDNLSCENDTRIANNHLTRLFIQACENEFNISERQVCNLNREEMLKLDELFLSKSRKLNNSANLLSFLIIGSFIIPPVLAIIFHSPVFILGVCLAPILIGVLIGKYLENPLTEYCIYSSYDFPYEKLQEKLKLFFPSSYKLPATTEKLSEKQDIAPQPAKKLTNKEKCFQIKEQPVAVGELDKYLASEKVLSEERFKWWENSWIQFIVFFSSIVGIISFILLFFLD